MATSGSYNWILTRDNIITRALRIIGEAGIGVTPSASQITDGADTLNALTKSLQNDGVYLWATEWVMKAFTAPDEVTGSDGEVYTCIRNHTSSTDDTPITGANYSNYWYLRGETGGTWADATAYYSINQISMDADCIGIEKAFIRTVSTGEDKAIDIITMDEYFDIVDKYSAGVPDRVAFYRLNGSFTCYFDRHIDIDDYDEYIFHVRQVRMLEDFDSSSDNPDLPVNWMNALIWGLAADMASEYGKSLNERKYIDGKYQYYKSMAMGNNRAETRSMFISPRIR